MNCYLFSWWNELRFVFRSLTAPYRARGSGHRRATTRRRRTCASSCLTSGLRPTRWSLWSIWYHACVTISTATSTRTSNPCSRGTSSRRCQVHAHTGIWCMLYVNFILVWFWRRAFKIVKAKKKVILGFGCLVCQGETDLGLSWVWLSCLLLFIIIVSCWPV